MFKELLSLPVTLTIQTRVCMRQIILLCWTHVPFDVIIKRRIIHMMRFSRNLFKGGGGPCPTCFCFLLSSSIYFTAYRGDPMVLLHRKLNFSKDPGGPTFSWEGGSKC